MAIYFYKGIIGDYGLEETDGALTHLWFSDSTRFQLDKNDLKETPLLREARKQLELYFSGKQKQFHLPLAPAGTAFQQKIWELLCEIPFGETRTYGQIATSAGNPKASRAVGMANNRNPLPIFIPCHRVIGANGSLTGYAGGMDIKQILLNLEKAR